MKNNNMLPDGQRTGQQDDLGGRRYDMPGPDVGAEPDTAFGPQLRSSEVRERASPRLRDTPNSDVIPQELKNKTPRLRFTVHRC
jgi:hypothetical protein